MLLCQTFFIISLCSFILDLLTSSPYLYRSTPFMTWSTILPSVFPLFIPVDCYLSPEPRDHNWLFEWALAQETICSPWLQPAYTKHSHCLPWLPSTNRSPSCWSSNPNNTHLRFIQKTIGWYAYFFMSISLLERIISPLDLFNRKY